MRRYCIGNTSYTFIRNIRHKSSIVYEFISTILKRKNIIKEDDIKLRIKDVSTVLESSVYELGDLQIELEERVKIVEKLKEQAETIIS